MRLRRFDWIAGVMSAGIVLTGCVAQQAPIADLGSDTYAVTLTAQNGTGDTILRQRAVDIGNDQCVTHSRYFYIVSEMITPTPSGANQLVLTFKCLKGDDPLLRKPDNFKTN